MVRIETIEIIYASCERRGCRWEWKTRGTVPAVCPKCKSRLWNKSGVVEKQDKHSEIEQLDRMYLGMTENHLGPSVKR